MFQIIGGCMEILVVRLDFSLLDCRGAGRRGISQTAFYESVSSAKARFLSKKSRRKIGSVRD